MCVSSSTRSAARLWAGESLAICAPTWSSTRSRWPDGHAARSSKGSSRTPTPAASFTSIRYDERLDEIGARPSIGSVGDSYDNALAESTNSLYKSELIRGPDRGPWKTIEDAELATLGWVHWFNTDRIHSYLDNDSPDQYEAAYAATNTDQPMVGIQ